MFRPKEFDVYEDDYQLNIEYKWYTPVAYLLGFFAILWNAFLIFWYSMAFAGGAPFFAFLVPLLHVAVGIFIGHQALSLFFNKTNITVMNAQLSIEHSPIPAFKGNQHFATDSIQQIYVKQNVGGKGSKSYEVRAKIAEGHSKSGRAKDISILKITGMTSERAIELEELLEQYIGITDQPVKGEHGKITPTTNIPEQQARRKRRSQVPAHAKAAYFMELGQQIQLKGDSFKVIHETQYDWYDGNSEKLFQLADDQKNTRFLYVAQDKAIVTAATERELNVLETKDLEFNAHQAPKTIELDGTMYILDRQHKGKGYLSHSNQSIEIAQWTYKNLDETTYVRVVENGGLIFYFQGTIIKLNDIITNQGLDLNHPNPQRRPNYDDEDFV